MHRARRFSIDDQQVPASAEQRGSDHTPVTKMIRRQAAASQAALAANKAENCVQNSSVHIQGPDHRDTSLPQLSPTDTSQCAAPSIVWHPLAVTIFLQDCLRRVRLPSVIRHLLSVNLLPRTVLRSPSLTVFSERQRERYLLSPFRLCRL